jgi:hypothetical protein
LFRWGLWRINVWQKIRFWVFFKIKHDSRLSLATST